MARPSSTQPKWISPAPLCCVAIVGVDDGVHLPLPDQPTVEAELVGAVGSRTGAVERVDE